MVALIDTNTNTTIYTAPTGGAWEAATILKAEKLNRAEGTERYKVEYL